MVTILHASDLHFGPPYDPEAGEALLDAAREIHPDAIVLSGDFTQRAKRAQFRDAAAFIDRLPDVPVVVTPGNHDIPLWRVFERLVVPYRNYREAISRELDSVTRIGGGTLVALNSTAPYRAITNGRIRGSQLDFAAEAFRDAPRGDARIVVAHHHFAPAPDYEGGSVMPRAREALDAFHRLDVDVILGGHLHRAYIGNSLDVHPGVDREHGIIILQCGTTTSRRGRARERAKNSLNVLAIADDHVRITHHMYFEDAGTFAPFSRHLFPRKDARFSGAPPAAGGRAGGGSSREGGA